MASHCFSLNKGKLAFLNNSSETDPIAHELDDEKADFTLQLRERELFGVLVVVLVVPAVLLRVTWHQSIEFYFYVEFLQVLLVVRERVEFKNFDIKPWYVLADELQSYVLMNTKVLFIRLGELQPH